MVLSSASADCHHCAERYVGPWYQRCSPDAAEAASVTNVGRAGRVPLAHSRLRAAVTASRRTRKRARGERERIMGAWVDPVPAPGESCAVGSAGTQRFTKREYNRRRQLGLDLGKQGNQRPRSPARAEGSERAARGPGRAAFRRPPDGSSPARKPQNGSKCVSVCDEAGGCWDTWRVLRASSGRLVGRDGELTRLLGLLDDASEGRPSHALISGDAGVGKTRLVAELATRAADRGFLVLSGRCAELGDSIPYLPLADALREGTSTPGAATEPLAAALAARPVLGRLLPDRDVVAQPGGEVSGLAQQQLFGAVLGLLTELADGHPVLLILEDLHWADRSTRDLVTFLSRVLHRERVAVVA